MQNDTTEIPVFSYILSHAMRPLPLWPMSAGLSRLARNILHRHPDINTRIDYYQDHVFLLDITDLPLFLTLEPRKARLRAFRRGALVPGHDAGISGPLAAFLAMLHGQEDGDTLFFSGALAIDGDTAAVLALRNALDDAELDLAAELAALLPPLAGLLRAGLPGMQRLTGLCLQRSSAASERAW